MQQRFPPPLLVFDLDGTLADTAGDLVASLNVILAREGLAGVEFARARAMVGGGARALIQSGLSVHGITVSEPRLDAMLADFLAYYEAHVADETALFPGVARTARPEIRQPECLANHGSRRSRRCRATVFQKLLQKYPSI